MDLDTDDGHLTQNMLFRIELTLTTPGARFFGLFPSFGRASVRISPGPSLALTRPRFVNRAVPFFRIKEDAIAVGELH